jgi:hypothetical protein
MSADTIKSDSMSRCYRRQRAAHGAGMRGTLTLSLAGVVVMISASCAVVPPGGGDRCFNARHVLFDHPDGPYTSRNAVQDFGNAVLVSTRRSVVVTNGALEIRFATGRKVDDTGLCLLVNIPPREQYTLEYRVRYDANFESGLHGKQFGLSGGMSYTGGLGQSCRENGDGWSVRIQFDAHADEISNQLYVYHCGMSGAYGESLGTHRAPFAFKRGEWHDIKLSVAMQSTAAKADGRIEVWCDGVKRIDVADVRFVTQESGRQIDCLRLESFPGGAGIEPTCDSFLQVDDFRWTAGAAAAMKANRQ